MGLNRAQKKTSLSEQHQSTLTDHIVEENHVIDWESVKVFDKGPRLDNSQSSRPSPTRRGDPTPSTEIGGTINFPMCSLASFLPHNLATDKSTEDAV